MTFIQPKVLLLVSLLHAGLLHATSSSNLTAGLSYYTGTETLNGKLVFLVEHDYTVEANSAKTASIYEFNLSQKQLKVVTDSPNGHFVPSFTGETFCVIYWLGKWDVGKDTNVFVYSESLGVSHMTNVESTPQDIVVADGHVFLKLQGYNFANPGYYLTESNVPKEIKLLDYNVDSEQLKIAEFSDARWQKRQSERFTYRSIDGRYIFFEGSGMPIEGTKLVSSLWNFTDPNDPDPRAKNTKTLHDFAPFGRLAGTTCRLLQISPDRHYALVELVKQATSKKSAQRLGSNRTYYLVDVTTGKTRILLEDNSEIVTWSSVSTVWWVQ